MTRASVTGKPICSAARTLFGSAVICISPSFCQRVVEQEKREWSGAGQSADTTVERVQSTSQKQIGDSDSDGRSLNVTQQDINVLALVKGPERYVFLFDDDNRAETLRVLGRYASDPDLTFSWYDAAVLSQKIRQTAQAGESSATRFELPLPSDNCED